MGREDRREPAELAVFGLFASAEVVPGGYGRPGKKLEWEVVKHLTFSDYKLSARHQWAYTRVILAQRFPGWTLDYIDSLSYADRVSIFAVLEAEHKVHSSKRGRD